MVRAEGLEPPHLSILEPKSSASTNSATRARPKKRRPITGRGGGATRPDRQPLVPGERYGQKEPGNAATAPAAATASAAATPSTATDAAGNADAGPRRRCSVAPRSTALGTGV